MRSATLRCGSGGRCSAAKHLPDQIPSLKLDYQPLGFGPAPQPARGHSRSHFAYAAITPAKAM